jgi:hypothetical protein
LLNKLRVDFAAAARINGDLLLGDEGADGRVDHVDEVAQRRDKRKGFILGQGRRGVGIQRALLDGSNDRLRRGNQGIGLGSVLKVVDLCLQHPDAVHNGRDVG